MKINQAFTILQTAGGIRAARIITEKYKNLSRINVWWMARKLRRGTPVAKIIHQKWFYGLSFYTSRATLDPRPDTETLVAAVIADKLDNAPMRILDLGTGTGCIIAALVKNIPSATGVGVDCSRGARRVARKNITQLGIDSRVKIIRGNFNHARRPNEKFDVIVSNPPYIARGDARVNDGARHDPKIALYAGHGGLAAYYKIAQNARAWVHCGGKIYLEIGDGQTAAVKKIFRDAGWKFIRTESDLSGIERVLIFAR